jgi:UDP:flavonoid glycosyltransferase YjiC (YdhE family)
MLHRRRLTPKKLAKAIRTVLDNPGMKRKAEGLSGLMQKEHGVQTAAALIENHLSSP